MRVAFITSSSKANSNPFKNQSLIAMQLLTILEQEFGDKLEVSLIDLRGVDERNFIYHIHKNDIFFYSVTTPELMEYAKLVKVVRKAYPKANNIAGGPHINIYPDQSLEIFDAIALGQGEEIIKQIVRDVYNNSLKRVYKQEGRLDINAYPHSLRKYYAKSSILNSGILPGKYRDLPGTNVLFSHGCPYSCYFCANLTRGPVQFRSPELIIKEIEYLKEEYGVEALALKDDQSIPTNKKVALQSLGAIAKTNIKWRGQSRANNIDEEVVRLAKTSGCVEVAVGVESVSQQVLLNINKRIDILKAKQYLNLLKKEGLNIRLLLMMGLPGEPEDIADQTIQFVKEVQPSTVLFSLFCPMPGSELYDNANKYGIKLNKNHKQFRTVFGRFDKNEKPIMAFEYEKMTPFGESMNNDKILADYEYAQGFLRENGYTEY